MVYDLIKEHHDSSSLQYEIGTCLQVEEHLKLHDEVPFFVHPYAIKEQKLVIQKEMNCLEVLTGYSSPAHLVKRKQ